MMGRVMFGLTVLVWSVLAFLQLCWAGSMRPAAAFRHVYQTTKGCGAVTGAIDWRGLHASQTTQHCVLLASYRVLWGKPTPIPTTVPPTATPPPITATPTPTDPTTYLLSLINRDRENHGVAPLTLDPTESACSLQHSQSEAKNGIIGHWDFPADICVPFRTCGENVGMAPGSAISAVATMHAEMMAEGPGGGHFDNLMNPAFQRIGIGLAAAGGYYYLTEDFVG